MEGTINKYGTMFIEKACDFEPYDYSVKDITNVVYKGGLNWIN